MLVQPYYQFQQDLHSKGIIFSFTGYVSEGILYALGEALKQKMALDETDANVTRKVFSIFVEQVQNIIRYSADRVEGEVGKKVELSSGMIAVGRENNRFFVVCGNIVSQDDVTALRDRLQCRRWIKTPSKPITKKNYASQPKNKAEAVALV
ncbi:SiaB family protein kinase [Aquaspirillum serpens]|uniref:SiaB family protein kinase n=1 Tax=Aquaspirillum serpens TaxID=190 RepID=UPI00040E217F|nr:SiaB family protein kinase [Aquaspirillum serpens]